MRGSFTKCVSVAGGLLLALSVWRISLGGAGASIGAVQSTAVDMCASGLGGLNSESSFVNFFTSNGSYMARTQCMVTQEGETDWAWVWLLVGLNALVIVGYMKIFLFWRKAYLQEEERDRNKKLMDLAWIFLFCACCGYVSSIMLFFWPAYRLLALALVPLAFFTWKFAANLEGFRISLSAKRLARELNESLQQQNERLSEEVELATRDLQAAKAEADRANLAKSEFLARMSHEIRTPLTSIVGFVNIAIDSSKDDEVLDPLLTVQRNSEHLLSLINDVLDVSKIEAGEMGYEFVPCSMRRIVNEAISLLQPKAKAAGTTLHAQIDDSFPARVVTDPTRVRQLLMNLVGNAIKFTKNGEITVQVKPTYGADDPETVYGMSIHVIDTGIGMAPEQAARVFEKFIQGSSDINRMYGGTGLGLTISRQIANDLGGDLSVCSDVGVGTEFTATLRCSVAKDQCVNELIDSPQHSVCSGVYESLKNKRILLVEDGRDNIVLIRHHFKALGIELELAENGLEGYQRVLMAIKRDTPFDLVIMDINMPKMDGITSVKHIRAAGCAVPIVMLSAHAMQEELQRSTSAGASAYCIKPIDFEYLFSECVRLTGAPPARRAS